MEGEGQSLFLLLKRNPKLLKDFFLVQIYFAVEILLCTWNITIHTWAHCWFSQSSFPPGGTKFENVQQGAICRSLLANWIQGPPAVSSLNTCSLCLEHTAVIDFISCENIMWMCIPRATKNHAKLSCGLSLYGAALVHDVSASDTKLALIYSQISSSWYALPDRLLWLWLQKLVFNY